MQGYLDCIAAMSAPTRQFESYRLFCAAYLTSSLSVPHSTENTVDVT